MNYYDVIDLGTYGDLYNSDVNGINEASVTVGRAPATEGASYSHAFRRDPQGNIVDLTPSHSKGSSASSVNDANPDQVVGATGLEATLWSDGGTIDLHAMLGNPASSFATDVNDSGMVTGWARVQNQSSEHAFLLDTVTSQAVTDLMLPGDFGGLSSHGHAINNAGLVVGDSAGPGGSRAFYYDGAMHALPTFGSFTSARDVSDGGHIVGYSALAPQGNGHTPIHAFLYTSEIGMVDLHAYGGGDATSKALAVNTHGDVVGYGIHDTWSAFLFSGGQMVDLNDRIDPGAQYILREARDINDAGQIVCLAGYSSWPDYEDRLVLLEPLAQTPPWALPKPGRIGAVAVDPLSLVLSGSLYAKLTLPRPAPVEVIREQVRRAVADLDEAQRRQVLARARALGDLAREIEQVLGKG